MVDALEREELLVQVAGSLPEAASGITDDSRRVDRGSLFVAVSGVARDGHNFIPSARASGAVAVVSERVVDDSIPV
ncbi:MAG: UDP-N-acetylmuramoyl-L-alanyl-D-glutamate--2,6-diaminopimelate ligase, partial [Gemmatimonadaceae bacterium]|nr:UDP-N-acetylmuramoyl-L-alanyl-D-glutamate--2,6-diaminopimelate ligase [Gemmatimonadaceae bacterium]